jgi:hypothetical protein
MVPTITPAENQKSRKRHPGFSRDGAFGFFNINVSRYSYAGNNGKIFSWGARKISGLSSVYHVFPFLSSRASGYLIDGWPVPGSGNRVPFRLGCFKPGCLGDLDLYQRFGRCLAEC